MNKSEIMAGVNHLQKIDEKFGILIDKFGLPELSPNKNYFKSLTRSIISQQLSGKAADTIFNRFLELYADDQFPSPEKVSKTDILQLRKAGLSNAKASYIIGLANAFQDGQFLSDDLSLLSDNQISEILIRIKGIGQWTADMFLIFTLNRLDILPLNDLGIKKGMKTFYNLKSLPSEKTMIRLSNKLHPYRSLASSYMWKIVDNNFNW